MQPGDSFVTSTDQRDIVRRAARSLRCRVLLSRVKDQLTVVLQVPGVGDPAENALTEALREWALSTEAHEWSGFASDLRNTALCSSDKSLPSAVKTCASSTKDNRALGNLLCGIHRKHCFLSVVDRHGKNYYFLNFDLIRETEMP